MKTPEKVLAKEQKQLAKLKKEQNRPTFAAYPIVLLIFMILLRMLDEFISSGGSSLQSAITTEFFVIGKGLTYEEGLSLGSLYSTPLMLLSILATVLMALSDRIGRKPMLLAAGFVSDKLGRKNASTIFGIATVAALIGFILCVNQGAPAAVIGILMGISTGAYWTVGDQIGLMMSESAPTNIRGSVSAAAGLLQTVVAIVAMGIMVAFVDLSLFCVVYGVIVLGIATVCLTFKVKETNGIDLSANTIQ